MMSLNREMFLCWFYLPKPYYYTIIFLTKERLHKVDYVLYELLFFSVFLAIQDLLLYNLKGTKITSLIY